MKRTLIIGLPAALPLLGLAGVLLLISLQHDAGDAGAPKRASTGAAAAATDAAQTTRSIVRAGNAQPGKGTKVPAEVSDVLFNYCTDCHDAGLKRGGINLDVAAVDWSSKQDQEAWHKVLYASEHHFMPPHGAGKPDKEERQALADWIGRELSRQLTIGGTPPRRLSKAEYLNTIRGLMLMPEYNLPLGFPGDTEAHGFNNVSEGLVLSITHMAAYNKVATEIADKLYPQPRTLPPLKLQQGGPDEMSLSFSASAIKDGKMRLASNSVDIMRSCAWPTRAAVKTSGVYKVTVEASSFKPKMDADPMILTVFAREVDASMRATTRQFRVINEIEIDPKKTTKVTFDAELYAGQTLMFQWKNAELTHDHRKLPDYMREWFKRDKRYLAAWQHAIFPNGLNGGGMRGSELRGLNGWKIIDAAMQDPDLDMSEATLDSPTTKKVLELFGKIGPGVHNFSDAVAHYYFNHGPSLQLHSFAIEGPSRLVDSPQEKQNQSLARRLAGTSRDQVESDEAYARKMLENFLPRAFRRPVDEETIAAYLKIATDHWDAGHSFNEGMHLLLRNVLISPRFLYRSIRPGELDDHDLAARLSYFLTQSPPDGQLVGLAKQGKLSDPEVLRQQALRLLPQKMPGRVHPFVKDFTGQWLDTTQLPEIMPDPKFTFAEREIGVATREVEMFFTEMLVDNRPMRDFIDPDFIHAPPYFADRIYQLEQLESWDKKQRQSDRFQRFEIPRGKRYGGLLSMSAIMMTTANGVDTQPVLRGVWVMENILGVHPPSPPEDVPALTPDTQGTTTPREMLTAHTNNPNCYSCHQHIDPLGFVLENFDPVGQWRDQWPGVAGEIDTAAVLQDGTPINDVVDLKKWVVQNEAQFAFNVADKLMVYGTGRALNHVEHNEVRRIVMNNVENDAGFRELILDLVASETFRTK